MRACSTHSRGVLINKEPLVPDLYGDLEAKVGQEVKSFRCFWLFIPTGLVV